MESIYTQKGFVDYRKLSVIEQEECDGDLYEAWIGGKIDRNIQTVTLLMHAGILCGRCLHDKPTCECR